MPGLGFLLRSPRPERRPSEPPVRTGECPHIQVALLARHSLMEIRSAQFARAVRVRRYAVQRPEQPSDDTLHVPEPDDPDSLPDAEP